jgi:hypothetical protein
MAVSCCSRWWVRNLPGRSIFSLFCKFHAISFFFMFRMWSACHKKSYLTNLEVRNLKSEISCLCPVWLSQFCLFWKKMGKGFVNIPKFVNSTHNKYLFLWHADHTSVVYLLEFIWFEQKKYILLIFKTEFKAKTLFARNLGIHFWRASVKVSTL